MAWIAPNRYLSITEMQQNAIEIWNWWRNRGYSRESCAALLGNMQQESTINPAISERGYTFVDIVTFAHGYGLIQWTPCSQYYSLMRQQGLDIAQPVDQLSWLNYECQPGRGYYFYNSNYTYRYWNWTEFVYASNPNDIDDLTVNFMWSRERPAYDTAGINARKENARYWYTFLGGHIPTRTPVWLLFKIKDNNNG